MTIAEWQEELHRNAKEKGFWDKERNIGEQIALMHSELSEALEEIRKNPDPAVIWKNFDVALPVVDHTGTTAGIRPKPEGFGIELADCVIRIFETARAYNIDIEAMMKLKHEYNKLRPKMHGKGM